RRISDLPTRGRWELLRLELRMKSAVIVFPASNCDRDARGALKQMTGADPHMVWHQDSELPDVDLVVLPGGFSYGDYLRCGAMASQSAVMKSVKSHAD